MAVEDKSGSRKQEKIDCLVETIGQNTTRALNQLNDELQVQLA